MPLKKFFRWFDSAFSENSEENSEDRSIECSLVRSLSDLREKELSKRKLSSDFHDKLFSELSKVEQDPLTRGRKVEIFIQKPATKYSLALASICIVAILIASNYSLNTHILSKIDKFDQSLETAMVEDDELDELDVITDLKKGQEDIDLLRKLEEYYTIHGYAEKADRVHYKLETISK